MSDEFGYLITIVFGGAATWFFSNYFARLTYRSPSELNKFDRFMQSIFRL